MAAGSVVEFVPARHPEAIRMDASKYKVIKPKEPVSESEEEESYSETSGSEGSGSSEDVGDETSGDDESETADDDENDDDDGSSSSDEDIEQSKAHIKESSRRSRQESYSDASLPERKALMGSSSSSINAFYDINETSNDRGTREPRRIHKSWPVSFLNKFPAGLENHSVTCYQNAALQALLHVPALGWYLLEVLKNKHEKVSKSSVTYELAHLFKRLLDSKREAVYPRKLIQRTDDINPMLSEWNQEDSHEYYMSLISRLQEDSVPRGEKLNSSVICDMFAGTVKQAVTCSRCHSVSQTDQDFYDLPVSFSAHESRAAGKQDDNGGSRDDAASVPRYTLEQSIKDFFSPEVIEPTNNSSGYQCEKCKTTTRAEKRIAIKDAPEYLTVHIKRFKMENNCSKKVKDTMHYPLEMDLHDYESDPETPLRYKLLSVIVHEGRTLSSGHYIAYTRQPNGSWYVYDDEHTSKVSEKEAVSQPSAYILVYSRLLAKRERRVGAEDLNAAKAKLEKAKLERAKAAGVKPRKTKTKTKEKTAAAATSRSSSAATKAKAVVRAQTSKKKNNNKTDKPDARKPNGAAGDTKKGRSGPHALKRRPASDIDDIFSSKRGKH